MATAGGERQLTPDELGRQYALDHPESDADLALEPMPEAEPEAQPEVETEQPEAATEALANPYEMTPAERRQWLANVTRDQMIQATIQYAPTPEDIVFTNVDYQHKTQQLADQRRELEQERNTYLQLLQQAQAVPQAPPVPSTPPPEVLVQYDAYGVPVTPDPMVLDLKRELDQIKEERRQEMVRQGETSIKQEMMELTRQHPWFPEAEHDRLRWTMAQAGIASATVAFRNVFFDRLMEEAVAKTRQTPAAATAEGGAAVPSVTLPPSVRSRPKAKDIDVTASPEEFGRQYENVYGASG